MKTLIKQSTILFNGETWHIVEERRSTVLSISKSTELPVRPLEI